MKFFPTDWRAEPALRVCSGSARGLWMEMLCIMHEATPCGSLVVNGRPVVSRQLAVLAGLPLKEVEAGLTELRDAGVFSVDPDGTIYSRRMRRDAARSAQARSNGSSGGNPALMGGATRLGDGPDNSFAAQRHRNADNQADNQADNRRHNQDQRLPDNQKDKQRPGDLDNLSDNLLRGACEGARMIATQRPEARIDNPEPAAPYDLASAAGARAKRFEFVDQGGDGGFRETQRACVEALGGYLPEGIAPADAHFGPMMALVDQGVPLAKILTALRSIRAKPPRTAIRTWGLLAAKVVELIAANPDASRAVAALSAQPDDAAAGGRVDFPGGHSATVAQLGLVLDRGRWMDAWHGKPGEPNCLVPDWAIAELRRRGHLPEVVH